MHLWPEPWHVLHQWTCVNHPLMLGISIPEIQESPNLTCLVNLSLILQYFLDEQIFNVHIYTFVTEYPDSLSHVPALNSDLARALQPGVYCSLSVHFCNIWKLSTPTIVQL